MIEDLTFGVAPGTVGGGTSRSRAVTLELRCSGPLASVLVRGRPEPAAFVLPTSATASAASATTTAAPVFRLAPILLVGLALVTDTLAAAFTRRKIARTEGLVLMLRSGFARRSRFVIGESSPRGVRRARPRSTLVAARRRLSWPTSRGRLSIQLARF